MQNPQKTVKCKHCNQQFQTKEFMEQHCKDKHGKDDRSNKTLDSWKRVDALAHNEQEIKKQKQAADQDVLAAHRSQIHHRYDDSDAVIDVAQKEREFKIQKRLEESKEEQTEKRQEMSEISQAILMRQTRQITVDSVRYDIRQEIIDIKR